MVELAGIEVSQIEHYAAISILQRATTLLSEGNTWTQGNSAVDAGGFPVQHADRNAVQWCAFGAVLHVSNRYFSMFKDLNLNRLVLQELRKSLGDADLVAWNDAPGRTKAEVVQLFQATTNRLELEGCC